MIYSKLFGKTVLFLIFILSLSGFAFGQSAIIDQGSLSGNAALENGASGTNEIYPPNPPFFFNMTNNDTLTACLGQPIYDTVMATDYNLDEVTLSILSGPGELTSISGDTAIGFYMYMPEMSGEFDVVFMAMDASGDSALYTKTYNIYTNYPPTLDDLDTSFFTCWEPGWFEVDLDANDPEGDGVTYRVLSYQVSVDGNGLLKFWADTAGTYCHIVEVSNECGADTATICVTVNHDILPEMDNKDLVYTICSVDSICFDLTAFDPDAGDNVVINQISGQGVFTSTGNGTATTCFLPANVDSADYIFTYEAYDDCLNDNCVPDKHCPDIPLDTVVVTVIIGNAAVIDCPNDTTIQLCAPDTLCFPVGDIPDEAIVSVYPEGSVWFDSSSDKICFFAEYNGMVDIGFTVDSDCGFDSCNFKVDVMMNQPPEITTGDTSIAVCSIDDSYTYQINYSDPENGAVTFELLSGDGTIDENGLITFFPQGSGNYCFEVDVADDCGATAIKQVCYNVFVYDSFELSFGSDTSFAGCDLGEICIPFDLVVPQGNENMLFEIYSNIGEIQNGQVCFSPSTAGDYEIIIYGGDECMTIVDTILVSIELDGPPVIECPNDTSLFICEPGTIEIPFNMPDGVDYTLWPFNALYNEQTGMIQFYTNCSIDKDIFLWVYNDCGTDSCFINVDVTYNSNPLVIVPPDTTFESCFAEEICIPVGVSDIDDNIVDVSVYPEGSYDPITGNFCFTPIESGSFTLAVTATDECGATDTDSMLVNVILGNGPIVEAVSDTTFLLCEPVEICYPINISDIDNDIADIYVSPYGYFDSQTGNVCFTPDSAGTFVITVTAVDSCGAEASATTKIKVKLNQKPIVVFPNDTSLFMCEPTQYCFPVEISDPEGALDTFIVDGGTYSEGFVCFTPSGAGEHIVAIRAVDECGDFVTEYVYFDIVINAPPIVTLPEDMELFQCQFEEVCIDLGVSDTDNNLSSVNTNFGLLNSDTSQICFTPDTAGVYSIVIMATDECFAYSEDTINVTVDLFGTATIADGDTTIYSCDESGTFSYPLVIESSDSASAAISIISGDGLIDENNNLIFDYEGAGDYCFSVIAEAACGTDTAQICIHMIVNEQPVVILPEEYEKFMCQPEQICVPVEYSDLNNNINTVSTTLGIFADDFVCFTPDTAGIYQIIVRAEDSCGLFDEDTLNVGAIFNSDPILSLGDDVTLEMCVFDEICLPIEYNDIDTNIMNLVSSYGNIIDEQVCFTPDSAGIYELVVTITDSCNSFATDTILVTITQGETASITCPIDPANISLCDPQEFCFPLEYTPTNAIVTTTLGQIVDGQICFFADTTGIYEAVVTVEAECGVDTCMMAFDVTIDEPVELTCPPDETIFFCGPDQYVFPMSVSPADAQVTILPEGIGEYISDWESIQLNIDTAGHYEITAIAVNGCHADTCSFALDIIFNQPPVLDPFDSTIFACELEDSYMIDINFSEPDYDYQTYFYLVSGDATIDRVNGYLTFSPDTAGTYCFDVGIMDDCGEADTITACMTIELNSAPEITSFNDTTIIACGFTQICLPIEFMDIDNNSASITTNIGVAIGDLINDNTSICFTPDHEGEYVIIAEVTDECGLSTADTAIVNVSLIDGFEFNCPTDTSLFICNPETICIPFTAPEGVEVIVWPFNVTHDAENDLLCLYTNCSVEKNIKIWLAGECYVDTCEINVSVTMNSNPLVIMAPDTALTLCAPEEICLPVGINDIDNNVSKVTASEGATYNEITGKVCFTPETAGTFVVKISALDDCGKYGIDSTIVTVNLNNPPIIIAEDEYRFFQCEPTEVCFPIEVQDYDNAIANVTVSEPAYYNAQTGEVCITPTLYGYHPIVITATDECGATAIDTVNVLVGYNQEPYVNIFGDSNFVICEPTQICMPVYWIDSNFNIDYFEVVGGDLIDSAICFNADQSGEYKLIMTVYDSCGLSATDTATISVTLNEAPVVVSADDFSVTQCVNEEICFDVSISDADNMVVSVETNLGYIDTLTGDFCFTPFGAGSFEIIITATDECGASSSDTTTIQVVLNGGPTVDAGSDLEYFQCDFEEICFPIEISSSEYEIDSVVVSSGYYNYDQGMVCYTPTTTGQTCLTITAYDACGAMNSDEICITITSGPSASITCPAEPFSQSLCDPAELCIPIEITPATADVAVSFGTYADGQICFMADTAGSYTITVIADEICGSDTCVVTMNVDFDDYVEITCPSLPISVNLCQPGDISILMPISPSNAAVVIEPFGTYNPSSNTMVFHADTTGQYIFKVIASTPCNADTCEATVNVVITGVPEIVCPADIDTLVCLEDIDEICFNVDIVGSDFSIEILPEGVYGGGQVCVPVTQGGQFTTTIIASSVCGSDTCEVDVNIIANETPTLTVPSEIIVSQCEGDTSMVCIDGIFAFDAESDNITITQTCGPGEFTLVTDDSGYVCFNPERTDTTYEFCFEATDGCTITNETFSVILEASPSCSVCVDVSIETDSCHVVGSIVPVYINVETNRPIGGFDLLIGFDVTVLSFYSIIQGDAISGWEYFTYRFSSETDCPGGCPSGLMRLVGIADQNDGPNHPPAEQLTPQGSLAVIRMRITNDLNLGGLFLPINFYWLDCGDNSFSEPSGSDLYVDAKIFDPFGAILWDEFDDANYPESSRPHGLGAADTCITGDKIVPERCVYFHQGGICATHPDSIDARGDINLNGVAYEIADAVVYTNFFIYGLSAFAINVNGQTAASDVNADGYTLTVADLVYMIRVIVGDANAIPKAVPSMRKVALSMKHDGDNLAVRADAQARIGAGLLIFEYDGIDPESIRLGQLAENMDIVYDIGESEIRALIYSMNDGQAIEVGYGDLLNIEYDGTGEIRLIDASFSTFHGDIMKTDINSGLIPGNFKLSQNYPNPFNPNTSINFSMPSAGDWSLTVINISGQIVKQFEGFSEAGTLTVEWNGDNENGESVASGIYFYRATAGDFSETKKMTLLK